MREGEELGEREKVPLGVGVGEAWEVRDVEAQRLELPVAHPEAEMLGDTVEEGLLPPLRDSEGLPDKVGDPLGEREGLGEGLLVRV